MKLTSGTDWHLEKVANDLLRRDREGVTAITEKNDILLEDQLELRTGREVYPTSGTPDGRLYSGIYKRAHNMMAGKRPTNANRFSLLADPWHQDLYEDVDAEGYLPGEFMLPGRGVSFSQQPGDNPLLPPNNPAARKKGNTSMATTMTGYDPVGPLLSSIEQWGKVNRPGWSGYRISNQGTIESLPRARKKTTTILRPREHWGTLTVRPRINGKQTEFRVDELVLEAFEGKRPPGAVPGHNNGDMMDCRLSNLFWDTSGESTLPRRRKSPVRKSQNAKRGRPTTRPPTPSGVQKTEIYQYGDLEIRVLPSGNIRLPEEVTPQQLKPLGELIQQLTTD